MSGFLLFVLVGVVGIVVAALVIGVLIYAIRRRGEPSAPPQVDSTGLPPDVEHEPPGGLPTGYPEQGDPVAEEDDEEGGRTR